MRFHGATVSPKMTLVTLLTYDFYARGVKTYTHVKKGKVVVNGLDKFQDGTEVEVVIGRHRCIDWGKELINILETFIGPFTEKVNGKKLKVKKIVKREEKTGLSLRSYIPILKAKAKVILHNLEKNRMPEEINKFYLEEEVLTSLIIEMKNINLPDYRIYEIEKDIEIIETIANKNLEDEESESEAEPEVCETYVP